MTGGYKSLDYEPLDLFDDEKGGATFASSHSHPPKQVLSGKGWSVWASKETDVAKADLSKFNVVLNLTGYSVHRRHRIPVRALAKYGNSRPREILLNWPDMQAVNLPYEFWRDLMRCASRWGWRILVFCVGGHGRTGTALACMLVARGWKAQDAIDFVRKNHCNKAIETETQERYIYRMSGEPFPEEKVCLPLKEELPSKKVICGRCGHTNQWDSKNCKSCRHPIWD